jgi:hypothetical protein
LGDRGNVTEALSSASDLEFVSLAEALGFDEERMVSNAERDFRIMVRPARVSKE